MPLPVQGLLPLTTLDVPNGAPLDLAAVLAALADTNLHRWETSMELFLAHTGEQSGGGGSVSDDVVVAHPDDAGSGPRAVTTADTLSQPFVLGEIQVPCTGALELTTAGGSGVRLQLWGTMRTGALLPEGGVP